MMEMKKTDAMAIILAPMMLVLAMQPSSAAANHFDLYPWYPHSIVTITSPSENARLPVNNVTLRFNIDLSLWYTGVVLKRNPSYRCYLSSIEYYLDGKIAGNIRGTVNDNLYRSHSVILSRIDEGRHSLKVSVTTVGGYWQYVGLDKRQPRMA